MTDTPDAYSRASRTSPDAIAERTFSQAKRGYSESEVRAYLRMVAADVAALTGRERDLASRVQDLQAKLDEPKTPPTDQDLINALGEETARVLGQARQSAIELRNKAEEHARRVVREAQETARELRSTTQHAIEAKTREAEDAARTRAKEIVGEARALRDRVLADLEQRRQELEQQVTDLRAGRGRLVETYELVERALAHAEHVMAEEPPARTTPATAGDRESEHEAPTAEQPAVDDASATGGRAQEARAVEEPAVEEPAVEEPAVEKPAVEKPAVEEPPAAEEPVADASSVAEANVAESGVDDAPTDVGALFEKLRSSSQAETTDAQPTEAAADDVASEPPAPVAEPATAEIAGADEAEADDADEGEEPDEEDGEVGDPAVIARDSALADLSDDLVRRGKRALQDEQNDLLDGLRRQRGKIDLTKVLPTSEDQISRWAHVLQPAVDGAYSRGAGSVEGATPAGAAPRALLTELATSVVAPLRERLEASISQVDTRTPADTELAVAQSLGARYREWRGDQLEAVLGDALAVAWSRGVFDTAPDGAQLRWVPAVVGKCPDCDDNALEPTVKGSDFPTGQPHPPAHAGCRCLVVVASS